MMPNSNAVGGSMERLELAVDKFAFREIIAQLFDHRSDKTGDFEPIVFGDNRIFCKRIPMESVDWSTFAKTRCNVCMGKGYTNRFVKIFQGKTGVKIAWATGVTEKGDTYIITAEMAKFLRENIGKPKLDVEGKPTDAFYHDTIKIRTTCTCTDKKVMQKNIHWYTNDTHTAWYEITYEKLSEEELKKREQEKEKSHISDPADVTAVIPPIAETPTEGKEICA